MIGDLFDSPWKILIVAVVIIVLFGSKKLPDAARSLGKSMRILKTEVTDLHGDEADRGHPAAALPPQPPQPAQPQVTQAPSQQQHIEQLQQQIRDLQQQQQASTDGAATANGAAVTETPQTQQPG
jgi:sec-independent protein translocase protein TatA